MVKKSLKINYTTTSDIKYLKGDIICKNEKDFYYKGKCDLDTEFVDNNKDIFGELPILFWCEDYADGSFPVKSCNNCTNCTSYTPSRCYAICPNYVKWQGEPLKGEPIRKGDKCWFVYEGLNKIEIEYNYWSKEDATSVLTMQAKGKFFVNETNAREYYRKLLDEQYEKELIQLKKKYNK